MAIETQKFIRKPLYVDAVKVTPQNFDAIVSWCQGEVMQDDVPGRGRSKKYIKVDVHNPKNPRQTKAKLGDWILKTDKGYKIYTDKAFHESFHLPEEDYRPATVVQSSGFTPEEMTLESKRQGRLIHGSEEIVPGLTVERAIRRLREEIGTDIAIVPATPEAIAQAVNENDATHRHLGTEGDGTDELPAERIEAANPHIAEGRVKVDPSLLEDHTPIEAEIRSQMIENAGAFTGPSTEDKIADAVEPTSGPLSTTESTVEVEGGVQINDSDSAPPPVRNGKRVLTLKEQGEMDAEEIRGLLQSGEVILAQDVAA